MLSETRCLSRAIVTLFSKSFDKTGEHQYDLDQYLGYEI